MTRAWPWIMGAAAAAVLAYVFLLPPGDGGDSAAEPDPVEPSPNDVEALARMIHSEEGAGPEPVWIAVAWAAKNMAARKGKSVFDLLTYPTGMFSHQGPGGGNGYASTALDARDHDREIAYGVLKGTIPDSTGGATQFDSPRSQVAGAQRNLPGYYHKDGPKKGLPITPDDVADNRRGEGKTLVLIDGVDEWHFRMWRPA